MKFEELFSHSFRHLRASFLTTEQLLQPMVGKMLSTDSRFCQESVTAGLISQDGMRRAAQRYLLGRSRSNETVFWMIDDRQRVRDGMVGDSWASVLLKERGLIDRQWCPQHCLFGQHLLSLAESAESADLLSLAESAESAERTPLKFAIRSKISAISAISARQSETICVVESVRSCVVLSERFPKYLWMATGYLANLNERLFLPLKGHHVVCFPATDPTGDTYLLWLSVAKEARKYGIDISVSRLLEDRASPTQKEQCIDLGAFLLT
jgi:hypothetical protein